MTNKRELKFAVQDVSGEVFDVTVEQEVNNSTNLSAFCNCKQADESSFCIHRFDILEGDAGAIVSGNLDDFAVMKSWIAGSDIEAAMKDLSRAKVNMRIAMENVDMCRRKLARRMMD